MIWFLLACFGEKDTDTAQNTAVDTATVDTSNGSVVRYACESDADCGSGTCLYVVDGHTDVRACQYSVDIWMHECNTESWGCCSDEECPDGICAAMEINYCGGAPPGEENECVTQECLVDGDCGQGSVCLDMGVLGRLTGTCIPASCTQNSDCTGEEPQCSLVYNGVTCPGLQLSCTNQESTCRWYGDCALGFLCVGSSSGASCLEEAMPP